MKYRTRGAEGEVSFKFRVMDPFGNPMTVVFWGKDKDEALAAANRSYAWHCKVEPIEETIEGNMTFERV